MPYAVPQARQLVGAIIDNGRLHLLRPLGRGSSGVVFHAIDRSTSEEYAVKCLFKAASGSRQHNFQARELQHHRAVSGHQNILVLHKVIEEGPYVFLVLDYCRGGDLFKFLTEKGTYRRNTAVVKNVFTQLIDAVEVCHKRGIYHRDIKPENIMCSEDGMQLKLGDFGLSTNTRWSNNFGAGTAGYMSPECVGILGGPDSYCARSNDVWALGVILTSMISGHNPWRRAVLTDDCFRSYVANPSFFRDMLPISEAADEILRRIFTNDVHRITLHQLRRMILDVDTFFMTDEEITGSSKYVQTAAASYLCDPPTYSSPHEHGFSVEADDPAGGSGEVRDGDQVAGWPISGQLEEIILTPVTFPPSFSRAAHPAPQDRSHPTTLIRPDVISDNTRTLRKRAIPPPQPMPSLSELMHPSAGTMTLLGSNAQSRKMCGSDSPVGLIRRFMDRIFV